jgi:UDP-glucose 4-epimerase
MMEETLSWLHQTLDFSYVALRYFNAAGADEHGLFGESHSPETHLLPLVLQTALGKHPHINIFGNDYNTPDGTCIRDYIHISDLAEAHCQALTLLRDTHTARAEALNLGTNQGTSVQEVITHCRKLTGKTIPEQLAPRRLGDPNRLVANSAKAQHLLGWQPQYDLEHILQTAWLWEQNRSY